MKELIFLYAIMKSMVGTLNTKQLKMLQLFLKNNSNSNELVKFLTTLLKEETKKESILNIIELFKNDIPVLELMATALKYLEFKKDIFQHHKYEKYFQIIEDMLINKVNNEKNSYSPSYKLTMKYDNYTRFKPYVNRVASIYFFYSQIEEHLSIKKEDIKNNIFQIILDESLFQSGRSQAGEDYEQRIIELFNFYNLKFVRHLHEASNLSQEHDMVIYYKNKTIGVGAKRTLRERYKQYNPSEIDLSLVFTIGQDLSESTAKNITSSYQSYILLADEIYDKKKYLQDNPKIFKISSFSRKLLDNLIGITQ